MTPETRKELRDYAWKYFDRHAEQRLKTFNFYILLCGASLAGICAILREHNIEWLAAILAATLSVLSLVFWKLDKRTRFLTRHSEHALKHIEATMQDELPDEPGHIPHRCKLFTREQHDQRKCGNDEWSYSHCFGLLFLFFGVGGAALAAYFLYMAGQPQ